jgi:hypothetical protein
MANRWLFGHYLYAFRVAGLAVLVILPFRSVLAQVTGPFKLSGSKVATDAQRPKAIFPMGDRIVILNAQSDVWAHEIR